MLGIKSVIEAGFAGDGGIEGTISIEQSTDNRQALLFHIFEGGV